ncbi:uncharacterized protein LOC118437164 [Folsomia candida]|uniref:uncharacterized protein LOC118437164 n=1 Tax=Folsomia candida TaxID=158441 RepID=UPI001604FF11|nr:uncharacterized protein LOC118437164 [Folsomia candida]
MYSKRFLLANHVFKNVSALLGANPILFDIRTNKFYSTPYSRFSTRFNLILLIIQFIFGTFRLFTFGYLSKKTDHELFIFNATYIIILAMFIPQICLVILTFNCQDEVDCLNQALQYMSRIREKWITLTEREFLSSYPTGYLLEYFHYVVAITVAGYWFFGCVAIYLIEILPFHWISLIPVQLRSRAVLWAHLAFYGHEILISSISVGIALQIVSSYIEMWKIQYPFFITFTGHTSAGISMPGVTASTHNVSLFPRIYTVSNSSHSVVIVLQLDAPRTLGWAGILPIYYVNWGIYSRFILGSGTANVRKVLREK